MHVGQCILMLHAVQLELVIIFFYVGPELAGKEDWGESFRVHHYLEIGGASCSIVLCCVVAHVLLVTGWLILSSAYKS